MRIEKVSVRRADGALSASGTYTMPRDMKSWVTAPGAVVFSLEALRSQPSTPNRSKWTHREVGSHWITDERPGWLRGGHHRKCLPNCACTTSEPRG